jgi:hypothetical protein
MQARLASGVIGLAGLTIVFGQAHVGAVPGNERASGVDGGEPDVIVGDISGFANYEAEGGIDAYAVGTTSCNIGSAPLSWFNFNNQHPVIGQNMFRLKDGRFEHIGQAFVKHGFAALNGNLCGTCMPTPSTSLGIGCSDPYSAPLNGSRTYLGPKWQIDATTGFFPYPFHDPPWSGEIARRLQVRQVDVQAALNPGASYWVEGQYVHPEDAAIHGRSTNNVGYREVELSSEGDITGFASLTVRMLPALHAWTVVDPEVVYERVIDPAQGSFFVAHRVYERGGGLYEYEYAVLNFDSDRSARRFAVPVPAGVAVTNVGFHDVDYHSGEPWQGTDWVSTVGGGEVRWETETFAQNEEANALRWGTLYNFRFTAEAAPSNRPATLELFKPGPQNELTVVVAGPSLTPCAADVNGDEVVDVLDLLELFDRWGASASLADVNRDGTVDVLDLLEVLLAWGAC